MKNSFNEVYNQIYRENFEELEMLRKQSEKSLKKGLLLMALVLITCLLLPEYAVFIIFGSIALFIIYFVVISKKTKGVEIPKGYREVFKEKVITPLISNVFEDATFNPTQGISRYEYVEAGYKDDIDRYHSEDLITAKIIGADGVKVDFKFSEVLQTPQTFS